MNPNKYDRDRNIKQIRRIIRQFIHSFYITNDISEFIVIKIPSNDNSDNLIRIEYYIYSKSTLYSVIRFNITWYFVSELFVHKSTVPV